MLTFLFGDLKLYRKISGGDWYYVSLKDIPSVRIWARRCPSNLVNLIKEEHY
jgi:hypothetical protein